MTMNSALGRRRRRRSVSGSVAGVGSLARRRRRRMSGTIGAMPELLGGLGRRKGRKGRKVCVRVGKRTYCGRVVAAPKARKKARRKGRR